jgi:hypothetical protein
MNNKTIKKKKERAVAAEGMGCKQPCQPWARKNFRAHVLAEPAVSVAFLSNSRRILRPAPALGEGQGVTLDKGPTSRAAPFSLLNQRLPS